jgi:Alkylmercury lyase
MTGRELALRRHIMEAFAATAEPPAVDDGPLLRSLAAQHVVVLDETHDGPRIRMAHPFARHREGTRVDADRRSWWGSCAWDGLGIVAALGLSDATVTSNGHQLRMRDRRVLDDALFHVAVPAREWWADIGFA